MATNDSNTSGEKGHQIPLFTDTTNGSIGRPCGIKVSVSDIDPSFTPTHVTMSLIRAIRRVFQSEVQIDQFEFIAYSDKEQEGYLLSVTTPTLPEHGVDATYQPTLGESFTNGRKPPRGSREHATSVLRDKLRSELPDAASIEPVGASFDPLGASPVTTCRLATRKNRRVAMAEPLSEPAFLHVINKLRRLPHIYQLLITNYSEKEFQVSIRVALCDRESQLPTKEALCEVLHDGWPATPSDWFGNVGLTSNFEIMSRHLSGANTRWGTFVSTSVPDRIELTKPAVIKQLAKGHPEFQDLITRRMGADPLYADLGYYPKFIIRERDLLHFIGLPPARNNDPWTAAPGRRPPTTWPIELRAPSSPTPDERVTTPTPSGSDTPATAQEPTTGGKDGNKTHRDGEDGARQRLRELGFLVAEIDQAQEGSVPDLWAISPTGEIFAVEIENQNKTKPASLLINAIRAEQWGVKMMIVGVSDPEDSDDPDAETKTKRTASQLQKPYREADGNRTRLYNQSSPIETEDGASLLLLKGMTEAEWWLAPDGTLSLSADGKTVAEGDASESVSSYQYELPRYRKEGDTYVVEAADGTVLHQYDSKTALEATWSHLNAPLVPTRLHYLTMTDFRYLDVDGNFEEFRIKPDWDTPQNTKRYREGLAKHDSLYLTLQEESRLPLTEYRPHALGWFRRLTEHKAPNNSYFEQCRPEYDAVEKKENSRAAETGKYTFYEGLEWRYPRGIVSPDLPDFSGGPTYPDEWDEENDSDDTEQSDAER